VEIEAKLGLLVDNQTGQRIRLPVTSLAVLENPSANNSQPGGGSGGGRPTRPWYTFKSDMSLDQHRYFNELLNRRARDTQSSQHRGAKVHYKHTREIDRFYLEPNPNAASQPGEPDRFRIRATFDKETAKVVEGPGAIIEKKKIANLDVYSPNTAMDFRITVSEEKPMRMPTVESSHERHKDRLSYRHEIWQFDLTQVKTPSRENSNQQPSPFAPRGNDAPSVTHELELELANTDWFLKERQRFQDRDPGHQFNTIVQTFVNNIYMLASHAR
ncbi:CYTH-like domain-containing protein, partial [Dimargaris cristalligena]